jgi:hypothetical protein
MTARDFIRVNWHTRTDAELAAAAAGDLPPFLDPPAKLGLVVPAGAGGMTPIVT